MSLNAQPLLAEEEAPAAASPAAKASPLVTPRVIVAALGCAALAALGFAAASSIAASREAEATRVAVQEELDAGLRRIPTIGVEDVLADALANVVSGPSMRYIAIGDWGRCGSPGTSNPVTRVRRCNEQRSLVPALEAWTGALELVSRGEFILSTGDQYYDGPMPISGSRDPVDLPLSAADLAAADADVIWDLSFRHIYDRPNIRAVPWYSIQGNHDYGGILNSQIDWGKRAPHPNGEQYDVRWFAPALNYNLSRPMLDESGAPMGGKNCVAFVAIDTCPLVDTYRAAAGSNTGDPERRATTGIRGIFQQQINSAQEMGFPLPHEQVEWLAEQLVEASRQCIAVVVTGHHPIYSRGQHGQSLRQQDLRIRLNLPEAFAWAGVDMYVNGHDHILELATRDITVNGITSTTDYIVSGAGSDVRTNNAPGPSADDDGGVGSNDDAGPDPGNPTTEFSRSLLEDNGFTVHSFNATHKMHALVSYNGTVVFAQVSTLNTKLPDAPTPLPALPLQSTLGTQCAPPLTPLWETRQMCLSWLGATVTP